METKRHRENKCNFHTIFNFYISVWNYFVKPNEQKTSYLDYAVAKIVYFNELFRNNEQKTSSLDYAVARNSLTMNLMITTDKHNTIF